MKYVLYRLDRTARGHELYLIHFENGKPETSRNPQEAMRWASERDAYEFAKYHQRLQCYRAGRR